MHTTKNSNFAHSSEAVVQMTSTMNTYYLGLPTYGKHGTVENNYGLNYRLLCFMLRDVHRRWSHIPAIRRWAWSIFYHTIERKCGDIPKQFHSCSNFGHWYIHHFKHCINLALPTLVPVLNSPVEWSQTANCTTQSCCGDVVDTQVKAVQSNMRKRAREETTPVPAMYNDHLIDSPEQTSPLT